MPARGGTGVGGAEGPWAICGWLGGRGLLLAVSGPPGAGPVVVGGSWGRERGRSGLIGAPPSGAPSGPMREAEHPSTGHADGLRRNQRVGHAGVTTGPAEPGRMPVTAGGASRAGRGRLTRTRQRTPGGCSGAAGRGRGESAGAAVERSLTAANEQRKGRIGGGLRKCQKALDSAYNTYDNVYCRHKSGCAPRRATRSRRSPPMASRTAPSARTAGSAPSTCSGWWSVGKAARVGATYPDAGPWGARVRLPCRPSAATCGTGRPPMHVGVLSVIVLGAIFVSGCTGEIAPADSAAAAPGEDSNLIPALYAARLRHRQRCKHRHRGAGRCVV